MSDSRSHVDVIGQVFGEDDLHGFGQGQVPSGQVMEHAGGTVLAQLVIAIVLVSIVPIIIWIINRQRAANDAVLSNRWQEMLAVRAAAPGADLVQVAQVYQWARRGTKAVIVWLETGYRQDSWFEGSRPLPGSILLVRGSTGWGPHNRNPHVFYVQPDQVLRMMPPETSSALARHQRRQAKVSPR